MALLFVKWGPLYMDILSKTAQTASRWCASLATLMLFQTSMAVTLQSRRSANPWWISLKRQMSCVLLLKCQVSTKKICASEQTKTPLLLNRSRDSHVITKQLSCQKQSTQLQPSPYTRTAYWKSPLSSRARAAAACQSTSNKNNNIILVRQK